MRNGQISEPIVTKKSRFIQTFAILVAMAAVVLLLLFGGHLVAHTSDQLLVKPEAYLPLLMHSLSAFPGPEEQEPNDTPNQANGTLLSGKTYHGSFPSQQDLNDFYFFYVDTEGYEDREVSINLSHIPVDEDYDLYLRNGTDVEDVVGQSDNPANKDENIVVNLPSGLYYIQVYNRGKRTHSDKYSLKATFGANPSPTATTTPVPVPTHTPTPTGFMEDFERDGWEEKWDINLDFSDIGYKWGTRSLTNSLDPTSSVVGWAIGSGANGQNLDPISPSYPKLVDSWLVAGPFDLTSAKDVILSFDLFYEANNGDPFIVSVSEDRYQFIPQLTIDEDVIKGDGQWAQKTISLTSYAGKPQIWLAFTFQTTTAAEKSGVFMDNVSLRVARTR